MLKEDATLKCTYPKILFHQISSYLKRREINYTFYNVLSIPSFFLILDTQTIDDIYGQKSSKTNYTPIEKST